MGWKIVAHSFMLVFRNLSQALRISVGPLVIAIFLGWLTFRLLNITPQMIVFGLAMGRVAPDAAVAISLSVIFLLFASAWVAVAWHRFVLLEEYPRLLPAIHGSRIAAYAGRSILLAVLLTVVMFPVSAIAGQILALTGLAGIGIVQTLFTLGLGILFTFLWLRIGIVLPATAIGRPYTLSQGWNDGGRVSNEVLGAAAVAVALNMTAEAALGVLPLGFWPAIAIQAVIAWLTAMVGSSFLTTLYGHLAERRPLT